MAKRTAMANAQTIIYVQVYYTMPNILNNYGADCSIKLLKNSKNPKYLVGLKVK